MSADIYRMWKRSNQLYKAGHRKIAKLIYIYLRVVFSCDILYSANIGENTVFKHHGLGVVINPDSVIGDNCVIYQNVSVAGRSGMPPPIIGNNVLLGANSLILGNVKIGDNVQVGAGCVVVKDIPANSVVVGNPARIIKTIY